MKLIELEIQKVKEGIKLSAKSDIIHEYFRRVYWDEVKNDKVTDFDNFNRYFNFSSRLMYSPLYPTLSFLKNVDLDHGITLIFDEVYTDNQLETCTEKIQDLILDFYQTYIKPKLLNEVEIK